MIFSILSSRKKATKNIIIIYKHKNVSTEAKKNNTYSCLSKFCLICKITTENVTKLQNFLIKEKHKSRAEQENIPNNEEKHNTNEPCRQTDNCGIHNSARHRKLEQLSKRLLMYK